MQEFYCLKNLKTGLYFAGFSKETRNKPLWVNTLNEAVTYKELEALHLQRRLENLYLPSQKIVIEEVV